MKSEKNFTELLGLICVAFFVDMAFALWSTSIIQQSLNWYQIPLSLSNQQIFGSLFILSLVFVKGKTDDTPIHEIVINKALAISAAWAALYLFHFIF